MSSAHAPGRARAGERAGGERASCGEAATCSGSSGLRGGRQARVRRAGRGSGATASRVGGRERADGRGRGQARRAARKGDRRGETQNEARASEAPIWALWARSCPSATPARRARMTTTTTALTSREGLHAAGQDSGCLATRPAYKPDLAESALVSAPLRGAECRARGSSADPNTGSFRLGPSRSRSRDVLGPESAERGALPES